MGSHFGPEVGAYRHGIDRGRRTGETVHCEEGLEIQILGDAAAHRSAPEWTVPMSFTEISLRCTDREDRGGISAAVHVVLGGDALLEDADVGPLAEGGDERIVGIEADPPR